MDRCSLPAAQTKQAPVDIPTFYKWGPDSIYQADSNSRVHSPNSLRMRSFLNHNLPSASLASSGQLTYDPFEESMSYDNDTVRPQVRYWVEPRHHQR